MNEETEKELTEEELRIWIAERCGWKRCKLGTQAKDDPEPRGWVNGPDWRAARREPPDYTRDLDAMAEAERQWFTRDMDELIEEYATALQRLCYEEGEKRPWFMATAGQRARAFYAATK